MILFLIILFLRAALIAKKGVRQKQGDCHGADSSRDRGDMAAEGSNLLVVDISNNDSRGKAIDSNIDDSRSFLDHVGLNEGGLTDSGNQDIS